MQDELIPKLAASRATEVLPTVGQFNPSNEEQLDGQQIKTHL